MTVHSQSRAASAPPPAYLFGALLIAVGLIGVLIGTVATFSMLSGTKTQATVIDCPTAVRIGCQATWTVDGQEHTGRIDDLDAAEHGQVVAVRADGAEAELDQIDVVALAILGGSLALVVAGFSVTRAVTRRHRYRITKPFSPLAHLGLWGGIAAVIAVAMLIGVVLQIKVGFVLVLGIPLVVFLFVASRTAFVVDKHGMNLGGVFLGWDAVARLEVCHPVPGGVRIGAWLRPGVQLPEGAPRPADPTAPHTSVTVQNRKFDLNRLLAKVRQFGPGVQVVLRDPNGERVLTS